jgi:hypothetical protein
MTERAEEIWNVFCGELTRDGTEDMRQALATTIRAIAERLYTDLGELQHPSLVLEEIADEVDEL